MEGFFDSGANEFRLADITKTANNFLLYVALSFSILGCGGEDTDIDLKAADNPAPNISPNVTISPVTRSLRQGVSQNIIASGSDADGQISQVKWELVNGPELPMQGEDSFILSVTPPLSQDASAVEYTFRVIVTDNNSATANAEITITTHWGMDEFDASRLLHQATMGPTSDDIQAAKGMSERQWIEEQMLLEPGFHSPLLVLEPDRDRFSYSSRINAWWNASLYSTDQLRQRVAFALSEILVLSDVDSDLLSTHQDGITAYYDLLLKHSFGNYRELLEAVTLSPAMGVYLSHLGNKKPDEVLNIRPDENYAREVMQLFTIGLVQLNQDGTPILDDDGKTIPTYTQVEIEGFAHVFTGWNYAGAEYWKWPRNFLEPMEPWEQFHDQGAKTLLGGTVLPAGQSARQDLEQALDNLFYHPNVAPFISKQLIQRLITSNPTPQYVERVANVFSDNGEGVSGDLAAVVTAILLDDEARQPKGVLEYSGKIREPLLRSVHFWRELSAGSHSGWFRVWSQNTHGQVPLGSPSVFNFFRPDYMPSELATGSDMQLVAPELQIASDTILIGQFNEQFARNHWHIDELVENPSYNRILMKLQPHVGILEQQGLEALLDYYDVVFFAGTMSDAMRQSLREIQSQFSASPSYYQVGYLLFSIAVSPEYVIQH
ncbi:DUF1800 domain-containing protein [Shewanella submarina]|uniref:DUF1800 family protein n=1 Tax=Shewanella submarina TaxID=2016376 RepID=A0ABV7GA94_9GAMM|nr:DUF1800 family protein [Shewanella submarina]MCL1037498.1 DUF1800 domain-containing protein [Shewanella submarina]